VPLWLPRAGPHPRPRARPPARPRARLTADTVGRYSAPPTLTSPLTFLLVTISLIAPTCRGVRGVLWLPAMMGLVTSVPLVTSRGAFLRRSLRERSHVQVPRRRQIWATEADYPIPSTTAIAFPGWTHNVAYGLYCASRVEVSMTKPETLQEKLLHSNELIGALAPRPTLIHEVPYYRQGADTSWAWPS